MAVAVGAADVGLGGTAVVGAGAAVEAAVAEGGATVTACVAVGSGVQVGGSTVGVVVGVAATVNGGVAVRVGMGIGVKFDSAACDVAVALSSRSLMML